MTRVVQSKGSPTIRQQITLEPDSNDIVIPIGSSAPSAEDKASRFWEEVNSIPADMWGSQRFVYLYRDNPKLNTKSSAQIEKLAHAFDPEWVRQKWGGYDFRALLCNENSKTIASLAFSVDAPPKNAGESGPVASATVSPASSSASGEGFNVLVQLMREQNAQTLALMERVLDRVDNAIAPRPSNSHEDTTVRGIVEIFTKLTPQGKDPLELFAAFKSMMPAQPDMLALLRTAKDLFVPNGNSGEQPNMLSQLDQMLVVAEKLGSMSGGKGPSVAQVLAENAPAILERAGSMIDKWGNVAEKQRQSRELQYRTAVTIAGRQPPVIQSQPSPPGAPATTYSPINPPPPVSGLDLEPLEPIGASQPPATESTPPPTVAGAQVQFDVLAVVKDRIVNAIREGLEGAMILDFLEVMDKRLIMNFEGFDEDQLAQFFTTDPVLNQAVALPRFKVTVREIVEALNGGPAIPPDAQRVM